MKLTIAILLLAASSAWGQQPSPPFRPMMCTTPAVGAQCTEIAPPQIPHSPRTIELQGGALAATSLIEISCDGQIKVRGKPSDDRGALGEALREYGKKQCARHK